jgi:serine/threonine protein kinase
MEDNSPNDRNKTTADLPPDATSQSATEFCSRADPRASTSETQPRLALQQGARLLDRYRIVRLLGQGASGSVYEAVDEARSGLRVAVKLLAVHQPQALYRLKNEFRALAETVHPNLVGLHSLAVEPHGWFVVMDLIDPSCDFRSYVRSGDAGKLDEGRLRSAFAQLVRGVCAIHAAGKLHRDLKPGNVLVTRDGRVVIVDFGLVGDQAPGGVGNTMDGWFSGTPAYAAPEQALGSEVGPKADVYALGVLLFEALTDRLPFEDDVLTRLLERKLRDQAPDPRSFVADAPEDLSALVLSMLQRDPELRPDAQQLLAGLESEPFTSGVMPLLPFVARESEIALLRDAAALVRDGSPVLLVLSGPSGIGKTALLTKFLELMQLEAGAVVLVQRL